MIIIIFLRGFILAFAYGKKNIFKKVERCFSFLFSKFKGNGIDDGT